MKKIILALFLVVFIFLLNFRIYIFNQNFYEKEFDKLDIGKNFDYGIHKEYISLINFLKNKEELNPDFFNEKEIIHLNDVKNLIKIVFIIFYIIFFTLIYFLLKNKKILSEIFLLSGIITMIII